MRCALNVTCKYKQINYMVLDHTQYEQHFLDVKYWAFHNVLRDYKHLKQVNQRIYLNGIVHSHKKTEKVFLQVEVFDVCTTGDTTHIDTIRVSVCSNNLNIVAMCTMSPAVHTSNNSSCKKKNAFSVFLWL